MLIERKPAGIFRVASVPTASCTSPVSNPPSRLNTLIADEYFPRADVITAGTFYRKGRLVFYDTHKPEHTIVVDLDHESYDQFILQVRDPAAAVKIITDALKNRA